MFLPILCAVCTQSKNQDSPQAAGTLRFAFLSFNDSTPAPHLRRGDVSPAVWTTRDPLDSLNKTHFFLLFLLVCSHLYRVCPIKKICFNQVFLNLQQKERVLNIPSVSLFFVLFCFVISNLRCCRIVYSDSLMQKAFSLYSRLRLRQKQNKCVQLDLGGLMVARLATSRQWKQPV